MHKERYTPTEDDLRQITEAALLIAPLFGTDTHQRAAYIHWLHKGLEERLFTPFELPLLAEDLKIFHRIKGKLQPTQRDLHRYKSAQALFEAVQPFSEFRQRSKFDLGALAELTQPRHEIHSLYNDNGLKVFIPLSQKQACRYGRETKWCISSTRQPNQFWSYTVEGPLIMVFARGADHQGNKVVEKFCFHPATRGCWNAADVMIDQQILFDRFAVLEEIIAPYTPPRPLGVKEVPDALERSELAFMPEADLDKPTCLSCVSVDGREIDFVPEHLRDDEMWLAAVSSYGSSIAGLENSRYTLEICIAAVANDGEAMNFVPHRFWESLADTDLLVRLLKAQLVGDEKAASSKAREWFRDFAMAAQTHKMVVDYDAVIRGAGAAFDDMGIMYFTAVGPQTPVRITAPKASMPQCSKS